MTEDNKIKGFPKIFVDLKCIENYGKLYEDLEDWQKTKIDNYLDTFN